MNVLIFSCEQTGKCGVKPFSQRGRKEKTGDAHQSKQIQNMKKPVLLSSPLSSQQDSLVSFLCKSFGRLDEV